MKNNAGDVTERNPHIILTLIVVIALAAASLLWMVVNVQGVAAAMIQQDARPNLTIEKSPFSAGELMAGDHLRQTVSASADIDAVYELHTSVRGDLGGRLVVQITKVDTGESLYHGPLTGAGFAGRLLAAGQAEELVVDIHLPSSADPGSGGESVNVEWNFSATRAI